jgi:hypothetical protein
MESGTLGLLSSAMVSCSFWCIYSHSPYINTCRRIQTEYFFGGGIQCLRAGVFAASQNMQPAEVIDLGLTSRTQQELEEFLRSVSGRFTLQTYDLLTNNCNNFTDTVAQFLLGRGIPEYIVNLPQIALSTPMGQMLRPMLEGMQNQVRAVGGGGLDPFGSVAPQFAQTSPAQPSTTSPAMPLQPSPPSRPPEAVLEEAPLVSADCNAASLDAITNKLLSNKNTETSSFLLSDEQRDAVGRVREALRSTTSPYSAVHAEDDVRTLLCIATQHTSCQMGTYFLLRLAVLARIPPNIIEEVVSTVLGRLQTGLSAFSGVPSAVMAVCTLSNIISNKFAAETLVQNALEQRIVDCILTYLNHERIELRQICATLLYNVALLYTSSTGGGWHLSTACATSAVEDVLPELTVQILCAVLENVMDESDAAVRRRRLAVTCRIIRSCGAPAVALIRDLGFADGLRDITASASSTSKTTPDEISMLNEITRAP